MFTKLSYNNFNKFRNKLIDYSKRFKIPFEDLEELVNDSILKALDNFDSERGSFESLCMVILKHKIFNFKRDNPFLYFLVLLDENENVLEADDESIEDRENIEIALNFLKEIKSELSEDELKLFNEIYNMCESSNKISISKASKNIGIEPLKGWDIFRKIQRKSNSISIDKKLLGFYDTSLPEWEIVNRAEESVNEDQPYYLTQKNKFSFSDDVINKLNSLYSFRF